MIWVVLGLGSWFGLGRTLLVWFKLGFSGFGLSIKFGFKTSTFVIQLLSLCMDETGQQLSSPSHRVFMLHCPIHIPV